MKLDLHGLRHENVKSALDSHIYKNDPPFEVVTGNSIKMRQIVLEVLKEHNLHYFDINTGAIVVVEKKL
jgi:hypothetical protein